MSKRALPRSIHHLHTFTALPVRVLLVVASVVLFAACTPPFNASIIDNGEDDQSTASGEDSEPDTDLAVTEILLDSPSDLEKFFDDESTTQLSENVTITAAVSGGNNHRWWVDGEEVTEGGGSHVEVGTDPESLTISREDADFESTYPVGTTIKITLVVDVDGETYSGSHNFEVVERSS